MRRPLRGQLLIPLTALVGAAVVINAAAAVWLTTVRQERAADEQLRQVARTLTAASFPLTPSVLERLKDDFRYDFAQTATCRLVARDGHRRRVRNRNTRGRDLSRD